MAFENDDISVVDQAVDHGRDGYCVAEDLCPGREVLLDVTMSGLLIPTTMTRPPGTGPTSVPVQKQPQPEAGAVGPGLLTPAGYRPIIRRRTLAVNHLPSPQ